MKLNRKLLMVLALVLSVAMATSGTMAYLSDTDSDVNVMTLGSVEIEQIEQEWNGDKLQDFTQAKPLYPAVSKDAEITGNSGDYPQLDAANVVDKYVSVKNTGKSDAYVRTVFAFEAGAYNTIEEFKKVIGYTYNNEDWTWSEEPIKAEINGQNYFIVEAIHKEAVKAGESTVPSLQQIYMDKDCDNEHVTGIDGNGSGTYDVLVVSQAVQTAGFADAVTALEAGFGKITATTHPWTSNNNEAPSMTFVTVKDAAELQAALDSAIDGTIILLGADITGDVTATQKPDVKVTIDGANNEFAGVITVDGKSATYRTAGLNIKNINFKADSISEDACINLGKSGDNNTRYTCNVTVENCTFDVPDAVGVKSYTGGDKNVTITNCTATDKAHSLCQLKGVDGVLIENCTVNSKNGMNFNNSDNVVVKGCTANVKGYAVRFGESSGGVGAAETYRIENSTLKSANDDSDATIILRGTADYSTLTIVNTTIYGAKGLTIANNATGATVIEESAVKADLMISNAEELFAFARAVNGGNPYSGKTVILTADIDLKNQDWEPIGQTGATQFKGIFDGRGNTIYNLNVDSSAHTSKHYSSGLFGWAESGVTIKNLTIDGATVVGNHNVAAVVGYTYSGKLENIKVLNANITANHANDDACGDKAGTMVGYMGDEARAKNLYAEKCSVKAGRDAGQLIGCGYTVSLDNCSAMDVTVTETGNCTGANINVAVIGRVMGD